MTAPSAQPQKAVKSPRWAAEQRAQQSRGRDRRHNAQRQDRALMARGIAEDRPHNVPAARADGHPQTNLPGTLRHHLRKNRTDKPMTGADSAAGPAVDHRRPLLQAC